MNTVNVVECHFEQHASQILTIFNDAILHSTALYEYEERSLQDLERWFKSKTMHQFPVIGVEDEQGVLMGFASYGSFRQFPANLYTVEHSVYVHQAYRGKGLAKELIKALTQKAKQQGMHTMIGAIDASNVASIALHNKLGFTHAGTLSEVGFKFGRWLDLAFYQIILNEQH
ncbi:GNAT family N-acetyltransferase [Acinetobacter rathckeae]|uniref:GNAT family N-acetyltransferase n=1 Tax=Acinetobacter rathckeae TaxID=2605272 RepID=UPI0018A3387A|nr:GNAT family N-acetyltransferase [Acinetobacter rathckeae]MBF7687784.1 N-acetyltransferase [Acinetobacter rathckeae]MBF7687993.1 N-acetyltransferase [Acinetobacter rathckeae]MBF7695953.1 N-acetyltransferase [Acinetobacter rathckeae]